MPLLWRRPGPGATPGGTHPGVLAHLYLCRGLSAYAIGEITGLDRQRVTRMLRRAGVPLRPRGAGRLRVLRQVDPPGLTVDDIGRMLGVVPQQKVAPA